MVANKFFSGRIPDELYEQVEKRCQETGSSKTEILIKSLSAYLDFPLSNPLKNITTSSPEVTKEMFLDLENRIKTLEDNLEIAFVGDRPSYCAGSDCVIEEKRSPTEPYINSEKSDSVGVASRREALLRNADRTEETQPSSVELSMSSTNAVLSKPLIANPLDLSFLDDNLTKLLSPNGYVSSVLKQENLLKLNSQHRYPWLTSWRLDRNSQEFYPVVQEFLLEYYLKIHPEMTRDHARRTLQQPGRHEVTADVYLEYLKHQEAIASSTARSAIVANQQRLQQQYELVTPSVMAVAELCCGSSTALLQRIDLGELGDLELQQKLENDQEKEKELFERNFQSFSEILDKNGGSHAFPLFRIIVNWAETYQSKVSMLRQDGVWKLERLETEVEF